MMKFIHKLTIVLALGGICGLAACSDDDQGFLKRNLREMSFPYVESSDTFTIRATGDWQISDTPDSREWTNAYGWVHVDQLSGKGDPGTYQKVTVTCDQNTSEERNATIYLHGCGEENVAIAIRQDNGIFEWKPFDNGQQFDVSGMLKLNAEAGAKLRIPYIKALGTEKYTVTVTQTGGDGITAASGSYSLPTAGNGYIEVPLTGTATKQGIVTFAVKATDEAGAEKDFGSVSTIVRAGFDAQGEELPLLTQNFGKFPWGGDCIGQKAGVTTADKTVANLSLDNETVSVSAGTNAGIGGITSTVRNGNAAFYRAIGMEGWTGYLNYMCPGYIQLGAASDNADGQPGNLISPVLNIPAGYDLLLTCKVAIWAAAPDQGMVGICEKNDGFWISKGTLDKIVASTKSYVARHPRLHVGRGHGRHPQSRRESQSGILHLHGRQLVLGLLGEGGPLVHRRHQARILKPDNYHEKKHFIYSVRPLLAIGRSLADGLQGRRRGNIGGQQVQDPEERETARIRGHVAYDLLGFHPRRDVVHRAARRRGDEPRERSALQDHRRDRLPRIHRPSGRPDILWPRQGQLPLLLHLGLGIRHR